MLLPKGADEVAGDSHFSPAIKVSGLTYCRCPRQLLVMPNEKYSEILLTTIG